MVEFSSLNSELGLWKTQRSHDSDDDTANSSDAIYSNTECLVSAALSGMTTHNITLQRAFVQLMHRNFQCSQKWPLDYSN